MEQGSGCDRGRPARTFTQFPTPSGKVRDRLGEGRHGHSASSLLYKDVRDFPTSGALLISGKTQQRYENDHRRRAGLDSGWIMPRAHWPVRPVTRMWMRRAATSASSSL